MFRDGRTVHEVTREYFAIRRLGCLRAAAEPESPLSRMTLVPLTLAWAIRGVGRRAWRLFRAKV
jgi:hypothetical protein